MFNQKHKFTHLSLFALAFITVAACNNPSTDSTEIAETAITESVIATNLMPPDDAAQTVNQLMVVHKSPTCGCCQKWVDYLEEEGFSVEVHNHDDLNPIKESLGMNNPKLYSCHTATIGNYLIEGHVPASDIKKILSEKPDIAGLTAPGMPMMSPGMNSRTPKDYAVLSFTDNGESEIYSQY